MHADQKTKGETKSLEDLAEKMRDIDFTLLSTHTDGGAIAQRPMSNNREVDYDGDSYYFTWDDSRLIADVERDPHVGLGFQGKTSLLGKPGIFVAVEGIADVVRDKARFAEHWDDQMDRWFKEGVDTPGVAMIHVAAKRLHYWDGEDEGELTL